MAIQRPLRWDNTLSALKEMSDTELEQMAYYLRYQWGQDLLGTYTTDCARDSGASVNSGFGAPYRTASTSASTSAFTHYGANADQKKTPQTLNNADNDEPQSQPNAFAGDDDDSFGTPSEASFNDTLATVTTYYKEVYRATLPSQSAPSTGNLNLYSYAYWDGSGYVKIEGVEANILDTIIKLANNEMLNGDKVGTVQLSTGDPSEGAGHVWSDLGTFFENTISTYSFPTSIGTATTTYKLYLKTDAPTSSHETDTTLTSFVNWSSGDSALKQQDRGSGTSSYSNFISTVLLPVWKRSSIFPKYRFDTDNTLAGGWEKERGSYVDTFYDTSQTTGPTLDSGTYYSARFGLALATSFTEYLILEIGSSTDSYRS